MKSGVRSFCSNYVKSFRRHMNSDAMNPNKSTVIKRTSEKDPRVRKIRMDDGWRPIDEKDPQVMKIGEYAVTEYNRRMSRNLELLKVEQGFSLLVAGWKYRLILSMTNREKYEAVVWEQSWMNFRDLLSFKRIRM